mmetsp:Transcript_26573/g.30400  ORF Transcript_26573/g.30400 Transcript_26573/m.30400 type:complete len:486 (-) Transcript_26573:102-1559(-)
MCKPTKDSSKTDGPTDVLSNSTKVVSNTATNTDTGSITITPENKVIGYAKDKHFIVGSIRAKHTDNNLQIGIKGTYYDVTKFAPYHPGGDVINEFHKKDATAQFLAYHPPNVLTRMKLKKVGTYDFDSDKPFGCKLQGDWMKLNEKFEKEGRYETPISYFFTKVAVVGFFFIMAWANAYMYQNCNDFGSFAKFLCFILGSICLAGTWQQAGFIVHDTMHNHIFHNQKKDQKCGYFFGSIVLGLSSKWWRDEHTDHHLYTNSHVKNVGPSDPQMQEDIWIQHADLIQYFPKNIAPYLLKFQKYYFIPLCVVVAPINLRIESMVNNRRIDELVGFIIHCTWVTTLILSFDTIIEGVLYVFIANLFLGVLTIQLLVSHYSKPYVEKNDLLSSTGISWASHQLQCVLDIMCPPFMDWFHGGLHLHSPHHLFPRMCRCHYRDIYNEIVTLCESNGLELDRKGWFEAVGCLITHLGDIENAESILEKVKTL